MSDAGLNSILDQLAPLRRGKLRLVFALGFVAAAAAVAALAQVLFRPPATLVFAVAVVACTGLFGLIPGLLSAIAAVPALDLLFATRIEAVTMRIALELVALALCTHFIERYVSGKIRRKAKPALGIRGQLDGIRDGEVYGWAMDCDHPASPVIVTISVDGRPAAEVAAVYYRPDVESSLNCSGSYGFYADLSPRVAVETQVLIEAKLPNGQLLENSPQPMTVPVRTRDEGPAVLFMHIPKTAGSAFREAIVANYRESSVAYLYGTAPGFLVGDLRRLPLEQRRDLRFVIGHFQFGIHHDLPRESLYVTVVREPGARMLSHYAYLRQTEPDLLKQNGRLPGLVELLERKPHIHFDNALVRHFGGVDERAFPAGSINQEHYEAALYFLRTGFTFVGHQEFAADAYAWLQQRFGWSARPGLEIVNAGLRSLEDVDRAPIRQALEKYNAWDCQLYREILRLFPYSSRG